MKNSEEKQEDFLAKTPSSQSFSLAFFAPLRESVLGCGHSPLWLKNTSAASAPLR